MKVPGGVKKVSSVVVKSKNDVSSLKKKVDTEVKKTGDKDSLSFLEKAKSKKVDTVVAKDTPVAEKKVASEKKEDKPDVSKNSTVTGDSSNSDKKVKKKKSGEIDSLFQKLRKTKAKVEDAKAKQEQEKSDKPKHGKSIDEDLGLGKERQYTEEGWPIYTPEELKLDLPGSGMSPDCPFDCWCCF